MSLHHVRSKASKLAPPAVQGLLTNVVELNQKPSCQGCFSSAVKLRSSKARKCSLGEHLRCCEHDQNDRHKHHRRTGIRLRPPLQKQLDACLETFERRPLCLQTSAVAALLASTSKQGHEGINAFVPRSPPQVLSGTIPKPPQSQPGQWTPVRQGSERASRRAPRPRWSWSWWSWSP